MFPQKERRDNLNESKKINKIPKIVLIGYNITLAGVIFETITGIFFPKFAKEFYLLAQFIIAGIWATSTLSLIGLCRGFKFKKKWNTIVVQREKLEMLKTAWKEEISSRKIIIEIFVFIIIALITGIIEPSFIKKYPAVIGGLFIAAGLMAFFFFIENLYKTVINFIRRGEIQKIFDKSTFRLVKIVEPNAKRKLKSLLSLALNHSNPNPETLGIGMFRTSSNDDNSLLLNLEEIKNIKRITDSNICLFISTLENSPDAEILERFSDNFEIYMTNSKTIFDQLFVIQNYIFIITTNYAIRIELNEDNLASKIIEKLKRSSVRIGKWPCHTNYILSIHDSLSQKFASRINENGFILGANKPLLWYLELTDLFTEIGKAQDKMNEKFEELSKYLLKDAKKIIANIPILQSAPRVKTQSIKNDEVISWLDKLKEAAKFKQENGVKEYVERYIYVDSRKYCKSEVKQHWPKISKNAPSYTIYLPNDTEYINYLKSNEALQNQVFKNLSNNYKVWIVLAKDEKVKNLSRNEKNSIASDWILFRSENYELLQSSVFVKTLIDHFPLFIYNYKYTVPDQRDEQMSTYYTYCETLSNWCKDYSEAKVTLGNEVDIKTDIPLMPLETFIQILEEIDDVIIHSSNSDILIDTSKLETKVSS